MLIGLDDIIAIIDKLIAIKNIKNENIKTIFEKILEPVFIDLTKVHQNYLELFNETKQDLENKNISIHEIETRLRKRRKEYYPVRVKIRSLINNLLYLKDYQETKGFIQTLIFYFPDYPINKEIDTPMAVVVSWFQEPPESDFMELDENKRTFLIKQISNVIMRFEKSWSHVCDEYAKLKILVYNK